MTTASLSRSRPTSTDQDRERLLQSFLVALDAAGRSAATARLYEYGLRKLFAFLERMGLGLVPLGSISREHLAHFLAEQRREVSPATVEAQHKAIRAFWRWATEEGEIHENVAAKLPATATPEKVTQALGEEETAALLRGCRRGGSLLGLRDAAIIAALLDTGLRASELLSLTVADVDRKERRALVLGKGARERVVAFEAKTLQLLDRYHRRAGITEGSLFLGRTGEPLSSSALYLMVRRRGEQVGIERLHPHTLRHTATTRLLAAGLAESHIRTLMGWSRGSRMLERYVAGAASESALRARRGVRLV